MKPRSVSATEMDVLKALWELGSGTVREIQSFLHERGSTWAYTTVLTLLQRLEAKGCVSTDKQGVAHVFRPSVSRDRLIRQRLNEIAQQVCEGETTPLVLALVKRHRFSPEEIEQFRRLLDRMEEKESPENQKR